MADSDFLDCFPDKPFFIRRDDLAIVMDETKDNFEDALIKIKDGKIKGVPETHLAIPRDQIHTVAGAALKGMCMMAKECVEPAFTTDDIVSLIYKGHDPREVLLQLAKREGSESAVINALRTHGY